jgi:hypothetical protein
VGKVFILDLPNRTDVVTAQGQVIVPAGCEAVFLQERVSVARGVLDYLKNLDRRGLYVPRQHWSNVDDETLLGAPRFEGVTSILTFERNPDLTNRGLALFDDNQKVEVIQLSHTSITDAGLVHLAGMRSLRELMIVRFEESGAGVTGEGLAHLVESHDLKVLNLSNNPITDAAIPHIIAFKKLSYLNLKGTRITSRGLAVLTRELPQCQIVSDLPVPRSSTPPKTGPIG